MCKYFFLKEKPLIMEYKKSEPVKLRDVGMDEKWLQDRIYEDPSILGLGDLAIYRRERIQFTGGRIDFILADPEDESIRYETEVMLGTLNESHIIRTIEYWDVERRRYPTLDHRAVIVAEDITNRFFNVISLMNKAIPIIAIQLNAFKVGEHLVLNFVKVLDLVETGEEEEPETTQSTRKDWDKYANPQSMAMTDSIIEIIRTVAQPKAHISIGTSGKNFIWCYPRKAARLVIRLRVDEERDNLVEKFVEQGVECKKGVSPSIARFNLIVKDLEQSKELLTEAIRIAESHSRE
jgi:hypothetical protein